MVTEAKSEATSASTLWARPVRWASWVLFAGLLSYPALVATGRWFVVGELAGQFRFYFGLAAIIALVPFVLARQGRQAGFVALFAVWGVWPIVALSMGSWSSAATPAVDAPDSFRMVCANVLRPNSRHEEVLEGLLEEDPHVIGLLELSSDWKAAAIERLGPTYPYHVEATNTDGWNRHTWGLMLFSKTEFTSSEVLTVDFDEWALRPILHAKIAAPFDLAITIAHPERPGNRHRFRARRLALQAIGELDVEGHWLLMGDLNTTSTSPLFEDLVAASGLLDSRVGFGRQPTWSFGDRLPGPLPLPLPSWARPSVAIDHALHSEGLDVLDRRKLHIPGSDHRAVLVDLREGARPLKARTAAHGSQ